VIIITRGAAPVHGEISLSWYILKRLLEERYKTFSEGPSRLKKKKRKTGTLKGWYRRIKGLFSRFNMAFCCCCTGA
jgi:hypothetical protein